MFAEDIGLGILPYEFGGSIYAARLDPADYPESAIAQLFPTRDDWLSNRLTEKIAAFIEETASYLAHEAERWYEIVRPPTEEASPQDPVFVLEQLPLGRLTRLPWWLIQHVPRESRRRIGKRFVTISTRDVWHITIPPELGTPRQHRRLLMFLGRNPFPPPFSVDAVAPGKDSKGYDFTYHRKAHQESVAYATRRWGWTGRGMWAEESSEYFTAHRILRFRRAQILLRDHILDQMNTLLHREGIKVRIVVDGLPAAEEIDSMLTRLERGTATYADALALLKR